MTQFQSLLVSCSSVAVTTLEQTRNWRPLALRQDQLGVDQILFLDTDNEAITHVAYLNAEQPFVSYRCCDHDLYVPNIACVDELLEPIFVEIGFFGDLVGLEMLPEHEAVTIDDLDDVIPAAGEAGDELASEIIDQLIKNTRNFNVQASLRWLRTEGRDHIARISEHNAEAGLDGELVELPEAWSSLCECDEQAEGLLSLLRSAFRGVGDRHYTES